MRSNQGRTAGPLLPSYRVVDVVPRNKYRLVVTNVVSDERPSIKNPRQMESCYVWDFVIFGGEFESKMLSKKTNTVYGNRSAGLTELLEAFNGGVHLTKDQACKDLRNYIGKPVDAIIGVVDGEEGPYNEFEAVLPCPPEAKPQS